MAFTIEISDGIYISGLSGDLQKKIKDELTFDNPAYKNALKFSKSGYTKIPQYICFYSYPFKGSNTIKIPIGVKFSEPLKKSLSLYIKSCKYKVYDYRNRIRSSMVPMQFYLDLRKEQLEAADAFIKNAVDSKIINGCIQMPTGIGKSILGIYLAYYYGVKTLIIVHKLDLLKGWKKDIAKSFRGMVNPGVIQGSNFSIGDFITIATVQTLRNLPEKEFTDLTNQFGMVILDEMHHVAFNSFALASKFNAFFKIGLTATPERNDGLGFVMQLYFGDFAYKSSKDIVTDNILPFEVLVKTLDTVYTPKVTITRGKYSLVPFNEDPLGDIYNITDIAYEKRPKVPLFMIDTVVYTLCKKIFFNDILNEYNKGHSVVVFFSQKKHLEDMYEMLLPYASVGKLYGNNTDEQNTYTLERAEENRKFITLTTLSKASEGTNVQQWEVAFCLSSVNNGKSVEQIVGRVRRKKENGEKLDTVKVYDYAFPNVYLINRHIHTRIDRYKQLRGKIYEHE